MGWDIAIWGTLKMDPSVQAAWRKTVMNGRSWKDWKAWFKNASPGEPREVAKALASWAKRSVRGHELLEVKAGKQGIEVLGYVSKVAFIEEARDIATLFRCAEKAGATGSITFAGVGLSEAYRLELTASGSSLKVLDEDLEGSPEVQRICRILLERDEAAQAAKAAKKSTRKSAESVPVPTTSPATKSATPGGEERGLSAEGQAALEEMYTRLAKADDTARVATLDRAGSEPLLRRLASPSVPLSVRVGAVRALCGFQSDETVQVLLVAFDEAAGSVNKKFVGYDSPLRRAAAAALVATGRQDVFAAVLSRLTERACKIKAGPTGQHIAPHTKWYEMHDYVEGITYVLGHAKYRPAWDRLAEVVRTSPLLSLRLLAIGALVQMADRSEIEGALGENADAFYARAFGTGVFNPTKPEEVGKKLIAYVSKQKRSL